MSSLHLGHFCIRAGSVEYTSRVSRDMIASITMIPLSELEFSFARSSGPGGQNVNKVNSKVILRFNLIQSESVSPQAKHRFLELFGSRVSHEGILVLTSDRFRDQLRNRED